MFMMAFDRDALPATIGLDWSYAGTWTLPAILRHDHPNLSNEEIFCEVVRRRGSVVAYEVAPADALRVWTKGMPGNDPSKWPRLADTKLADVERFN